MTVLEIIVYAALSGCAVAGAIRIALGPSLADRVAALDVVLVALMGGIAADAGLRDDTTNLPLIVVIAIVGFTATVASSRYIEHEAGSDVDSDVTLPGGPPHQPGAHLPGGQS